jgi:hypothetical protein
MAKSISDTDELVVVKESRKFKGRMRSCASPCLPRKSPRLTGTKNHLLLVARHPQYFLDYETSFAGLSITLTNIFAHESFVKIGAKEVIDELLFAFVFRSSCLIPEHDVVVPPPFGLRRFRWI